MQPLAEPNVTSALLTVESGTGVWALPSAAVTRVEAFDAAESEPAADLLELLGVPSTTPAGDARVLVMQVFEQRLRILVRGALKLLEAGAASLLPLPDAMRAASPLVTHLAVVAGKPALFVVSPERLLQALRDGTSPSSPLSESASR